MPNQAPRPPLFYRMGTRVAVGVTLSFLIGSIVLTPIWEWIAKYFHPTGSPSWYQGWSLAEVLTTGVAIVAIGAVLGGVLGMLISRVAMRRLVKIASEAAAPFGVDDSLPGPFDESGRDEISQLAGALNRMRTRATKLMSDLGARDSARAEWVAQVSHDLRTPLAALTSSLDLIEMRLKKGETGGLELLVHAARADSERVAHLAIDLLEIARLEVDPTLTLESVDPAELAEHARRAIAPLALEKGIQLTVSDERKLGGEPLEADGRLLLRALENLLANSIQHAKSQVTLRFTSSETDPGAVRFTVEDDGPGLPETNGVVNFEDLKNHRSRADSSGLGLIVTARVAELHGGRADAGNPESGGASVWFEVARTPAA